MKRTSDSPNGFSSKCRPRTWDELYRNEGVVQSVPSSEIFAVGAAFRQLGVKSVLDLGCGAGRHARVLADHGFAVWGCDRSREACELAARLVPDGKFETAEMVKLPYSAGFFDAIVCYQVIQHGLVEEAERAVAEMTRVLKAGGSVFVRVPSIKHPEARTGEEIELGTRLGIDAIDGDVPHHYFTQPELESLFVGFNILSLKHKPHPSEKDPSRPAASWSLLAELE